MHRERKAKLLTIAQTARTLPVAVLAAAMVSGCANMDPTLGGLVKVQTTGDAPKIAGAASTGSSPTGSSPIGGPVAVPDGAPGISNASWPAARGCRIVPRFTSTTDVDTLYAHTMHSFNFKSPEQIAFIRKTVDSWYLVGERYLHEKQSGAYYHLAQSVSYTMPSGTKDSMWLDLEFVKNGKGADVSIKYCTTSRDPQVGTVGFHQNVQKMIRDSL
jgi:hypothetical protein